MTDASQGTGVVEIREGGTLANFQNVYERVLDDVVQIGFGQQALIAGKFPLTEVVVLPFIVKDNTVGWWRCGVFIRPVCSTTSMTRSCRSG